MQSLPDLLSPVAQPRADASAWVGRHQAAVWRWARVLGCAPSLADELAQDALIAALAKGIDGLSDDDAAAWLRGAVRNLWRMEGRRRARRREVADSALVEAAWESRAPDGGESYLAALRPCLAALGTRGRRAVELRYRERASRAAMAAELELSEQGVKTLLRRVRDQLRSCVERRRGEA